MIGPFAGAAWTQQLQHGHMIGCDTIILIPDTECVGIMHGFVMMKPQPSHRHGVVIGAALAGEAMTGAIGELEMFVVPASQPVAEGDEALMRQCQCSRPSNGNVRFGSVPVTWSIRHHVALDPN